MVNEFVIKFDSNDVRKDLSVVNPIIAVIIDTISKDATCRFFNDPDYMRYRQDLCMNGPLLHPIYQEGCSHTVRLEKSLPGLDEAGRFELDKCLNVAIKHFISVQSESTETMAISPFEICVNDQICFLKGKDIQFITDGIEHKYRHF